MEANLTGRRGSEAQLGLCLCSHCRQYRWSGIHLVQSKYVDLSPTKT